MHASPYGLRNFVRVLEIDPLLGQGVNQDPAHKRTMFTAVIDPHTAKRRQLTVPLFFLMRLPAAESSLEPREGSAQSTCCSDSGSGRRAALRLAKRVTTSFFIFFFDLFRHEGGPYQSASTGVTRADHNARTGPRAPPCPTELGHKQERPVDFHPHRDKSRRFWLDLLPGDSFTVGVCAMAGMDAVLACCARTPPIKSLSALGP